MLNNLLQMLYNLAEDPHEQTNLAKQNPGLCHQAAHLLGEWHDAMMQSQPDAVDPLWTVMREGGPFHARGHLKAYCTHLERTGRGHAIPELKRRHPGEFA